MAEPGRNDPCPCGSGKKFKHCCLKEEKMAEDTWEIDPKQWTLNDLVELQDVAAAIREGTQSVKMMRALLARLVVNKTEEEIGEVPLLKLPQRLADLNAAISKHMAIPK